MSKLHSKIQYLGRFGELIATMYLMGKKISVHQLGNANQHHDLICETEDGKLFSVQVKTSSEQISKNSIGYTFRLKNRPTQKSICPSDLFIFICHQKNTGNFYIYEFENAYIKNNCEKYFYINNKDLHQDHLFITKKIPNFADDFDEDFESEIPLLWDLIPLVQVNKQFEAA